MEKKYGLILFDLDGTLAPFDSDQLYPDAAAWMAAHPAQDWRVVTNQGGIGLRYWMESAASPFGEPEKYPTLKQYQARLEKLFPETMTAAAEYQGWFLMCARYKSKSSGNWSPVPPGEETWNMWRQDWRKPAPGMLLYAMKLSFKKPEETLMVGDGDEDERAAAAAGCAFMWAWDFFGREVPSASQGEV